MIPKTRNGEDVIPYVDKAIAVIDRSKVKYRVSPLETTMEGDLSELLTIVKDMHEAMIEAGCPSALAQVKIAYNPDGMSMDRLTEKYDNR